MDSRQKLTGMTVFNSMLKLGVNIDHVATLRQARRGYYPDPILAAQICEKAGADSIVCHLREDRRHIQDNDVMQLRKIVRTRLNLEMSLNPEIIKITGHIHLISKGRPNSKGETSLV